MCLIFTLYNSLAIFCDYIIKVSAKAHGEITTHVFTGMLGNFVLLELMGLFMKKWKIQI